MAQEENGIAPNEAGVLRRDTASVTTNQHPPVSCLLGAARLVADRDVADQVAELADGGLLRFGFEERPVPLGGPEDVDSGVRVGLFGVSAVGYMRGSGSPEAEFTQSSHPLAGS